MPPVYKVLIIGGGVIGLSLARQLRRRSIAVTVSDPIFASAPDLPGPTASRAAAGMLAVEDPGNPPLLLPVSRLSRSLYDDFLNDIGELSGRPVPFQTQLTRQTMPDGSIRELSEQSLDPRQLGPALRSAVQRLGATLTPEPLPLADASFDAVVYTAGAWTAGACTAGACTAALTACSRENAGSPANLPVTPRKGQMLRVSIRPGLHLREVHRAEHVYVVPRLFGPQAGTALLGATVEDAGFDATVTPEALKTLRSWAAGLVPALADERLAPAVEAWAGLRPATPDGLPLLGELLPGELLPDDLLPGNLLPETPASPLSVTSTFAAIPRRLIATGHYRNGILLAPATAVLIADLLEGIAPADSLHASLQAFRPGRFKTP